jgi:hypothetical protein
MMPLRVCKRSGRSSRGHPRSASDELYAVHLGSLTTPLCEGAQADNPRHSVRLTMTLSPLSTVKDSVIICLSYPRPWGRQHRPILPWRLPLQREKGPRRGATSRPATFSPPSLCGQLPPPGPKLSGEAVSASVSKIRERCFGSKMKLEFVTDTHLRT